ncbi:TonB-dependent receptor plug domain-containing protein [Telluria sp. B2]
MGLPRRCHLYLFIAGLPVPAYAQQSAPDGPVARVEVKGGAASYDPRRDDTATRIVVGREEIERYGDTSVFDLFRRIPGVTVTRGAGRDAQVRMRGLGEGYTQILLDGERTPAGFTLDTLAPETIERIEVLRAATAEFPTESVAGTINIVLRKKARKREREAKLGYLLSDEFRGPTFSTQLADRGERSSWSFSASGNHDGLARESTAYERNTRPDGVVDTYRSTALAERGRMNRLNLAPRFNWTLESGDTVEWESLANGGSFRNNGHARVATRSGNPPPVPDLLTFGEFDDRMLKSDLRWTHGLASGAKLEARLGLEGTRRKTLVRRIGADSLGRAATNGSVFTETHAKGASSTGKYARAFEGGHLLALGWDLGFNASEDLRAERDTVRVLPPGQPPDETFAARVARAAVYAQDEWTLNPRWSVYLGARWEGVRTRVTGNTFEPARVRSSVLSPVFQSLWKLPGEKEGQSDQLRLAVSRTYKAPDLYSLVPRRYAWENNSATEADYQGNPHLKPELAWGIDAAWEHYWAQGAMVSLSGALRRIDNYTSNRIYFDGLRWLFTPANEDRAEMRSLELETRFPLAALVEGAPSIDLRASVSRNWSRVESVPGPNNRMEQQTPLTANLGIDYKRGALSAGGSVAHRRGGQVRVAANRGFYSEARTDLEAYAVWKFNPKLQLRVVASNLLGEHNVFEPSYTDPAAGTERRRWDYPESVKLRTTLEMTF